MIGCEAKKLLRKNIMTSIIKNGKNPWFKLRDKPPYILDFDKNIISSYNRENNDVNFKINTGVFPVPYIGDFKKAKILLLQLNPGLEIPPALDSSENHEFKLYKDLKNDTVKNIKHFKMEYPFYFLNPKYRLTGGFRYWANIFSPIIKNYQDYKKIANKVCCAEFFPYHSKKYKNIKQILESQKYSFDLVKKFIKRTNTMVILMRGEKEWINVLKFDKLIFTNFTKLRSKRNPILSRKNFFNTNNYKKFSRLLGL